MENNKIGHMEHLLYFSSTLPKGSKEAKNTKWDLRDSLLFEVMESDSATTDDTYRAQKRLVELGYLEPNLIDGKRGRITDGAIRRWRINTDDSTEKFWLEISKNEDMFSKAMHGMREWWKGE